MSVVRWALVCAAAAMAVAATPAHPATGWTSAAVSEPGALTPTGLEFAADGTGILTWEGYEPGHEPSAKLSALALGSPLGAWTRGPDLPGVTWGLARVHAVAARTFMVGMRAYDFGAYNRARWEVVTATGRLDGSFGGAHALVRDVRWTGSASGGRGELIAAWISRRDDVLHAASLLPARRRSEELSAPGAARPLLVIGPRGHVLAAWTRGRRIEARLRTPRGHWGPVRRIAADGPIPEELHGAVGPHGDAVVAWGASTVDEDRPARAYLRAATFGGRWTTHRLESYTGAQTPPTAVAAFDAGGRAVVAWAGEGAVKIARPTGRGSQALPVTGPVSVDDIAVSRAGEIAVAFSAPTPGQGSGPGPFVTSGPALRRFTTPVDVGVTGAVPLQGAKLAFDPVTARPTVAWVALESGRGRVWTATRDAG